MIIIEGMDGAGKTTLFTQIARHLNTLADPLYRKTQMLPSIGIPVDDNELFTRMLEEQRNADTRTAISDRCEIISDFVYGGINRARRLIALDMVTQFGLDKKPFFIFCDPTHEAPENHDSFRKMWVERVAQKYPPHSPMNEADAFDNIYQRYSDVITFGLKPDLVYNWSRQNAVDLNDVLDHVKHYLRDSKLPRPKIEKGVEF